MSISSFRIQKTKYILLFTDLDISVVQTMNPTTINNSVDKRISRIHHKYNHFTTILWFVVWIERNSDPQLYVYMLSDVFFCLTKRHQTHICLMYRITHKRWLVFFSFCVLCVLDKIIISHPYTCIRHKITPSSQINNTMCFDLVLLLLCSHSYCVLCVFFSFCVLYPYDFSVNLMLLYVVYKTL